MQRKRADLEALLQSALQFLVFDVQYFRDLWNWSALIPLTNSDILPVKCLAYHCIALVGGFSNVELKMLLKLATSDEGQIELSNWSVMDGALSHRNSNFLTFNLPLEKPHPEDSCEEKRRMGIISNCDLHDFVANIEGVLLNRLHGVQEREDPQEIVLVPSVQETLHNIALAISANDAVVLQGPVGCGKTSLVEYLAQMTGRKRQKDLLKIQLGDRMDSKLLIGSHCCTEIPGKFVWQPGVLTEAMLSGHWLLLEDIDCASMDVISTLIPVLQSRSIVLPGRDHPVKAAGGFQLFATQRLLTGHGGTYMEFKSNADILDKLWRKITVSPLSRDDLHLVICAKWPELESIVDRILEVYFMVCTGTNNGDAADNQIALSAHGGRIVSTRDLFKWCKRIAEKVQSKSPETAIIIFKAAIDYFCQSISIMDDRIAVAESIAAKFNIPASKAAFFCKNYKPDINILSDRMEIGQTILCRKQVNDNLERGKRYVFAHTRQSVALLEKVASAVQNHEPVLLVGETGTGKTSVIQYLADITNNDLIVVNMNQQSDSIDLLGGYKPIDLDLVITPLKIEYEKMFCASFSQKQNTKFLMHIMKCFRAKRWGAMFTLMMHTYHEAVKRINSEKYSNAESLLHRWQKLSTKINQLRHQVKDAFKTSVFTFIEGTLVKAMKEGKWILLDEINLAEAETLECFAGVLDRADDSLFLLEKGDKEPVTRHPDFHIFACMNPATDIGKKDLPVGIRNRFTEFFVEELEDKNDLMALVDAYLRGISLSSDAIENIVDFYFHIREKAAAVLSDGASHNPHYSLRTLCRALYVASRNSCDSVPRSLYEAFCLSFLSQLDEASHVEVKSSIMKYILGKKGQQSVLKRIISKPKDGTYLPFEGYWIKVGTLEPCMSENYILTPTVRRNLQDLARIVSIGRYPVLLQGDTSVGKTSLVQWLAEATGNECVRVNNHEHTDIQEYIGGYAANNEGNLVFEEGVLVKAMRNGYWIILDELNLAPTEVMEALNRVLDDNRELFITETQEVVRAHSQFMVFATQNPPGTYGGRKVLSRAFRNRFVELHFSQIPPRELETILEHRCKMPLSYCKRLVAIMAELQLHRGAFGVFAGKQAYFTLRDLFRWGERYKMASAQVTTFYDWDQHLGEEGYMLLAGRVRRPEEEKIIREVIQKHIKCVIDPNQLFAYNGKGSLATASLLNDIVNKTLSTEFKHIVWTDNMRRLTVLVAQALKFNEPILLVGDTGCGKTTVCQLLSAVANKTMYTVNCHMHTESADFLGSLRPYRGQHVEGGQQKLFEWVDGPLVKAMKTGDFFLVDEISLAEDSVLERLNSLLEPERTILLTEKCGDDMGEEVSVRADSNFRIFSTMNPGGDFGKKELSPALRNRFTEIWCPSDLTELDLVCIVQHNIVQNLSLGCTSDTDNGFGLAMSDFVHWFRKQDFGKRYIISIRDILSWVDFINATAISEEYGNALTPGKAYCHGACLVYLDSLGAGITSSEDRSALMAFKKECLKYLIQQVKDLTGEDIDFSSLGTIEFESDLCSYSLDVHQEIEHFGVDPFVIKCGSNISDSASSDYTLESPTPKANVFRIMRALQVSKPILLEGSPGVGKTSLVAAIARASGNDLVRINLSEQTDITDLFGADLPTEGGIGGEFSWRDGPLLQALRNGHWILLDELNLASQSVLEGLNACLDHRGEVFVPELNETFYIRSTSTRIFGCQNPYADGGARKGLPRSFLNRFTQVFVDPLSTADLKCISYHMFPLIPYPLIVSMVNFNQQIVNEVNEDRIWGQDGHPWEFNLRDICRWCEVMLANQDGESFNPGEYVGLIYADRMRTRDDKEKVFEIYQSIFDEGYPISTRQLQLEVFSGFIQLGHSFLTRHGGKYIPGKHYYPLHFQLKAMESLMKCIELRWMAILLGPSGCGKTSMVQFLASLIGHPLDVLSMNSELDTTELLGGFEQADFARHIDGVCEDLSAVVWTTAVQCFVRNEDVELLTLKEVISKKAEFDKIRRSGAEGDAVLLSQIDRLKHILNLLGALPLSENEVAALLHCKETLDDVSKKLSESNGAISGGKFEWVDGVLVRAIKKGHWLLIENANFCSASVLDRLNGLLEPGGVLTINEQGAIGEELVTITPHDDFRIVLTMDPKKGEISRAMRNRGVEIALLSEGQCLPDKGEILDIWDIVTLFQSRHLRHPQLIEILLKIHQGLGAAAYCNVSFSDLLSCASLVMQNIQHKVDVQSALWNSLTAVYVKPILDCTMKENSCVLIRDMMVKYFFKLDSKAIPLPLLCQSSSDFQLDDNLASIKQKGMLFQYILHHITCAIMRKSYLKETPLPEFFKKISFPPCEWVKTVVFTIRIVIEKISFSNWNHARSWMEHCFSEAGSMDMAEFPGFQYVDKMKSFFCTYMLESLTFPAVKELKNILHKMVDNASLCSTDKDDIPWDPRWNPCLFNKLLHDLKSGNSDCDIDDMKEKMVSLANRFHLLLILASIHLEVLSVLYLKNGSRCLLAMSRDFGKNERSQGTLHHPVIEHLCPFFGNFHESVRNLLMKENSSCSNDVYWKVWEILNTYYSIVKVCCETFNERSSPSMFPDLLSRLTLLWPSVLKEVLNIFNIKSCHCSVPSEVMTCALRISHELGLNYRNDHKLRSKLVKFIGFPSALSSKEAARVHQDVIKLASTVNLSMVMKSQSNLENLRVALSQNGHWNRVLSDAFQSSLSKLCHQSQLTSERNALHRLELQLCEAGLLENGDEDVMEVCDDVLVVPQLSSNQVAVQLQLLPLWDYFFVLIEVEMVAHASKALSDQLLYFEEDKFQNTKINVSLLNYLTEIGISKLQLDPVHVGILLSGKYGNIKNIFSELLVSFLDNTRNGFSSRDLLSCLHWDPNGNVYPDNSWKTEITWANQSPVLTYICFNVLSNIKVENTLEASLTLGTGLEKGKQIAIFERLLWRNCDALWNKGKFLRKNAALVVTSWFDSLVSAIALCFKIPCPHDIIPSNLASISDKLGLSTKMCLVDNADALLLAAQSIEELKSCLKNYDADTRILLWIIGKCYTYVGLLTLFLLAPTDSTDPVEKYEVKSNYCGAMLKDVQRELELRNLDSLITSGNHLEAYHSSDLHPFITSLIRNELSLNAKYKELKTKLAYRPFPSQFSKLQSEVRHYLQSVGSPSVIYKNAKKLEILKHHLEEGNCTVANISKCLLEVQKFRENQMSFVDQIKQNYPCYRDLTLPFLAGVEQVILGTKMMSSFVSSLNVLSDFPAKNFSSVEEFLIQMASFPTMKQNGEFLRPLEICSFLSDEKNISGINFLCSTDISHENVQWITLKSMKCAVLEMQNEILIHKKTNPDDIFLLISAIFKTYCEAWINQENEFKLAKEQEASLYEQKVHYHDEDKSDEEQNLRDMNALFPSYKEEFSEFLSINNEIEGAVTSDHVTSNFMQLNAHLSDKELLEIWSMHAELLASITDVSDSVPKSELSNIAKVFSRTPDFATPYHLRYEILKRIVLANGEKFDNILDVKLLGGHLFACSAAKSLVNISNEGPEMNKYYDIYHDPNPPEVLECRPLLENLSCCINNLLEQFPDNPLLTQVLKIVDRILSFTVNSPLMKYLTGLELVLESAQAWEQNAHKDVSLCRELSEITDKIIHCRRIELNCWRQCLDNVVKKQYAKCAKWWFHLYSLIFFTNNDDEVLNQGGCDKAFRDSSIKTLQQFMEDSELGQFAARLDLLRTFFLHVLLSPRSSPKRKFLAVLFNIYNFYKQFLPAVMKKIDDIRTPIEKEIKDYVKIAQWNDTNFVTVKQTVEKSHNTIHKYMKNFEKELVQPIKSSFHVPSKKGLEEIESTPWSLKIDVRYFTSKLKLPEFFHLPDQVEIDEKTLYSMDEKNFISNISHFHRKSNKFCKKILELYPVLNYINFLNDFSGEIIEVAQNLGSLVVTKDEDKKRQVMEAKQIHHSKRKALSKLFKTLSILGLSYSQGLIYCRNRNESDSMVVPHLDVNNFVYYMKDKTAGEIVKACWNGANHYFYKCIAQFSSFLNALQKPSKELSLEIVQKSQGFSGHLMELAITQRKILAKEIEDLTKFRNKVLSLLIIPQRNDCTERKNLSCLPSQDFANQWRVKLCNIIIQTISALQQFIILMECCPLPAQEKVFDIDLPACLPPLATACKRDHLWTTTVNQAQNILEKARNIISKLMLELESSNIFLTWGGIKTFSECFDNLFSLSEDIARLKTGIEHQEETNYFTESLQSVYSLIITEHLKFKEESSVILEQCSTWTKPAEELDSELITNQEIKFSKVCNELLQSVLFAIQGLFVLCNDHKTITGNLKLEEMNHKLISEKINEHLFKTRDLLSVHKIKKNVTKLLKCINKNKFMGNIVCFEKCVRMACKVAPLLFQYVQLVEFYISVSFGMHRTTCKILSVLLGIFDDLCQKGFCLPQESQKENEQCNSTEFHDIENGGLGEGEGVRDISGNVRSEDQLEDVMKEGTEKTEQELDPPDIKEEKDGIEMSEDFDGKLHEPDTEISDESDEDYNDDSEPELDKKMGDVDSNQATDLNEKLWGSDSENENEDLDEDESNKGTVEKGSSELAPKNEKKESCDESETKDKEEKSMELHDNEMKNEDEYEEDNIDPLINKQPPDEPEIMELPNEMNLDKKTDDSDDDREDEQNEFDIDAIKKSLEQDNENGEEEGENVKEGNSDIEVKPEQSAEEPMEQDDVEGDNDSEMCPNQEVDAEDDLIKEKNENEQTLSSFNKTEEFEALAAEDTKKNKSNDNVEVSECDMDWEGGGGEQKEQHKEGQADFKDCESHEVGYEGNRTTAPASLANKNKKCQRFKHADENRSLASVQENIPEKLHTVERKKTYENLDNADVSRSDCYEHIKENEKEDCVTLDIATDEQVLAQALSAQETTEDSSIEEEDDDDDVIAVDDSDDEDEEEVKHAAGRTFRSKSGRNGNHGDSDDEEEDEEDNDSDIPGEHIVTSGVSRGPLSTIHTQFDLWTALSMPDIKKGRIEVEQELEHFNQKQKEGVLIDSKIVQELWQKCEDNVSPLVQELCEQLRLVLEPTKMTKLKGDYRSGKRLNMRKIIPYIASQFRKDKIWLRRMKPSKRQYQIMLAIDDSSSMTDNHSKQLAFESLALIGKSLSLLEAGELSIISFGESIKLLNSFSEPFTDSVGCRILKELSFSQNRTRFGLLLNYATDMMIQSRTSNCSQLISKEIAQLLLIISDGRGIFNEGEELVHSAVRRARDNNVFMIFVVLDNSSNEQSILDIRYPIFDPDTKELVEFKPYMSKFPFPFYILLREINSLPLVLGEALRKWFELVTSVDR